MDKRTASREDAQAGLGADQARLQEDAGKDLDEDVGDTVKQATGKEAIHPPTVRTSTTATKIRFFEAATSPWA